jgi:hypothetical protein
LTKKCVSEGCTNQSVNFGKCISHGAKVNKTKCKALLSSGERCKKYTQKYGLCRKYVNYNIDDIVQNPLEGEVIQESQGPEEGKRKSVAIRAGVLLSPDYMEVDFDLERTPDNDVEHRCYPTMQTMMWTEAIIMEGGLETEESKSFQIHSTDFQSQMGDWSSQTKVFTITIVQGHPLPKDIAAMDVTTWFLLKILSLDVLIKEKFVPS